MNCSSATGCTCGCCEGTSVETPQIIENLPGQPAITYRAGTWATFRESMLARLSSAELPALADLRTRDSDDFTIAFLDASSVVMDILTFYQERLANESYLRTAVQQRSLVELTRLIGYQPSPGVSASTYLAFTLKSTPGQPPNPNNPAITIPAGTQAQSVPAQGQKPQTFETSTDILAKADWNALPVQTAIPWTPAANQTSIYLSGTSTQLQPGDAILIVGDERANPSTAADWAMWFIRIVLKVEPDTANGWTRISWNQGLAGAPYLPTRNPKIYALRQRAALFGYNAIDPNMLHADVAAQLVITGSLGSYVNGGKTIYYWKNFDLSTTIDLDAPYPKVVQNSWVALVTPFGTNPSLSLNGYYNIYKASDVSTIARSDFGMSGKITRVSPDRTSDLGWYLPQAVPYWPVSSYALAQSELLPVAAQPLHYPLYGTLLDLDGLRPDLLKAQVVALFGKAQKIAVAEGVNGLQFVPDNGATSSSIKPGEIFALASPSSLPLNANQTIPDWTALSASFTLSVLDSHGRPGSVTAPLNSFSLVATTKDDPTISEYAVVTSVADVLLPYPHTQIVLESNLTFAYERLTTTVNANVALATHGSSVTEILGSGSAATANQSFALKQTPLTFVAAATPSGSVSSLNIRASGVEWKEVPTLFGQRGTGRLFARLNQPGGNTSVLFGDSVEGATLPTGQNNIQAKYRIGIGAVGNVSQGAITTLMDRPLGVNGVINPEPATGGQDAASITDIRSDAPQTVLTLGRAVSIADYQNFASTFAGIAKAYALWTPAGPGRGVFLTVAGVGGAALPSGNPTLAKLISALQDYGSPLTPLHVVSFLETLFGFTAALTYDPAYDAAAVQAQVRETLASTYSFPNRTFGQGIASEELSTVIQNVPGVVAVNVSEIHIVATSRAGDLTGDLSVTRLNSWLSQQETLPRPASDSVQRICAYLPLPSLTEKPQPAEILVLHPDPAQVKLGVMA